MATPRQLAEQFVNQARQNPAMSSEICRSAAQTFMGYAMAATNPESQKTMSDIGLEFARAASRREVVLDDFTDLLRETHQAYNEVGDDPQDLVARRREIHDERTKINPGETFVTPPSFNKDVTLGRSLKIKWNPTVEEIKLGILQSQTAAFWQGVKREAQAMTIDINLANPPDIPLWVVSPGEETGEYARPFAEIEYGSDGNKTKVQVDLALGKRLTVVGNYISVIAGMAPPPPGIESPILTVGASIGAFAAPSVGPVVLTKYIDGLANLQTSQPIAIPPKAVALLPIQSDIGPVGGTFFVTFRTFGGIPVSMNFFQQAVNDPAQPIPIHGDAAFVTLTNTSGTVSSNHFRLPFQLAL